MRALSGVAKLAVDEMLGDIACENGVKNVMNSSRESFAEYIAKMERAFVIGRCDFAGLHRDTFASTGGIGRASEPTTSDLDWREVRQGFPAGRS